MTFNEMEAVLDQVSFTDYNFLLWEEDGRPVMQISFYAPDNLSGQPSEQRGRKWFMSYHMTKSEVVASAFKACLTSVEHEARESFLFNNEPIFGPHMDVDALYALCKGGDYMDVRSDGAWVAANV